MGRIIRRAVGAGGALTVGLAGCAAVPPQDNPALVHPSNCEVENPVLLAPGLPTPDGYADIYERILDALDDYFEIKPGSRYAGQIETLPRVAPGYEQPWKPGSPDRRERLLATFQSIRHTAVVRVSAGERGGYRVHVEVTKEMEDLGQPAAAVTGPAIFRNAPAVEPRAEVVSAVAPVNRQWFPVGRDYGLEQVILRKIQENCR